MLAPLAAAFGILVLVVVLWDAFETVLLPRRIGRKIRLTRFFYATTWRLFRGFARGIAKPARREAALASYGPLSLLLLLACWAAGMVFAFSLLQFASGSLPGDPLSRRLLSLLYFSGETFFTLGFGDLTPSTSIGRLLSVMEAGMGFAFLGTVIGYLPTIYNAFSQREIEISLLDARAGSPPTAAEFLRRASLAGAEARGEAVLCDWERWSAQLLETHISYPLLAYYRSQHSNQSWLSALTAILDSTALVLAGEGHMRTEQAQLTFAMARHALVDITQLFVSKPLAIRRQRLARGELARLCEHLQGTPAEIPDTVGLEEKLGELRLLYEPYAEALADYLLLDLPPWVPAPGRDDNWARGPWDKQLASAKPSALWDEEHF